MVRWTVPLGLLFAALVLVFALVNDRPNIFGLLAVVSLALSGLTLLLPVMYALNERMTAYYVDAHWMAEYRGKRRDMVDLDALESINREALLNVRLKSARRRLLVPAAAIRPAEVCQLLGVAVQVAQLERPVQLDESVRALFEAAPAPIPRHDGHDDHDDPETGRTPPPPLTAWDAVRTGRRRRAGSGAGDDQGRRAHM